MWGGAGLGWGLEQAAGWAYCCDTWGLGPPGMSTSYLFSIQQEALLMASFSLVIRSSK